MTKKFKDVLPAAVTVALADQQLEYMGELVGKLGRANQRLINTLQACHLEDRPPTAEELETHMRDDGHKD